MSGIVDAITEDRTYFECSEGKFKMISE